MKALTPYPLEHFATKYGGWATLCDPDCIPADELYNELDAAEIPREQFDNIRTRQRLPARQRVILDVTEDLLRIWTRYLCGFLTKEKGIFEGSFAYLGQATQLFLDNNNAAMNEHNLSANELERFIQSCLAFDEEASSVTATGYLAERMRQIAALARLCQCPQTPPDEPGGGEADLGPALVPRSPSPPNDSTSISLPIPGSEKAD